jgi:hypothetical protein
MSLDAQGRDGALASANVRLLPVDNTAWADISATVAFGPFEPGDWVVIIVDAVAHVNAKGVGDAAIATNPQLPAGIHDFVVPDGATYVHLFGNGSGNGVAFKAS